MSTSTEASGSSLSPIAVVHLAAQPALIMRAACGPQEVGATLAAILPRVFRFVMANGHTPSGPPFAKYVTPGDPLTIEAGTTLAAPGEGEGDILPSELPEGSTAALVHSGPYEGLPTAHAALAAWARANGKRPRAPAWELYLTDPASEPDPRKWQTKVFLPIMEA